MKSRIFLFISLAADLLIAISKFVCAGVTGSASMVSEAIHSVIDAISQLLLIWGVRSSKRVADSKHPFGYGRELYYWSLIVSLVIFIMGGCISCYEGFNRLKSPTFEGSPTWNYTVLGIAFVFNLISMLSALRAFNAQRGKHPFFYSLIKTKDPSTIIVLLSDFGDLFGLLIAFGGIFLGRMFNQPSFDGFASILIGVLLLVISGFLIRESKSLLLGETIGKDIQREVIRLAETDEAVTKIMKVYSIYRSPEDAMLMLNTKFHADLSMEQLTQSIKRITHKIQLAHPQIRQVVIAPV